jgi:hypothetical protein
MSVKIAFGEPVMKFDKFTWENGRPYRRDLAPGAAAWAEDDENGKPKGLNFVCPCGCAMVHSVTINPLKARDQGWDFDGNRERPTLTPSIFSKTEYGGCGWHGYLTAGEFKSC